MDELDPIRESLRRPKRYTAAHCVCSHSRCVHPGAELNRRCPIRTTHWMPDFSWGACDKCVSIFVNRGIFVRSGKNCPSCQGLGKIGGIECRGCEGLGVRRIGASKPDGTQKEASTNDPLPVEPGLYWRLHRRGRPFGPGDATSEPFYPPDLGDEEIGDDGLPLDPLLREFSGPRPGYSAYAHPAHLREYAETRQLMTHAGDVVAFRGEEVGRGWDDEPLVMPSSDRPIARMSWEEFERRLRVTRPPDRGLNLDPEDAGGWEREAAAGGDWGNEYLLFAHMVESHGLTRTDIDLRHLELGHELQHRNHEEGKSPLRVPHGHGAKLAAYGMPCQCRANAGCPNHDQFTPCQRAPTWRSYDTRLIFCDGCYSTRFDRPETRGRFERIDESCPSCRGMGFLNQVRCRGCSGLGRVRKSHDQGRRSSGPGVPPQEPGQWDADNGIDGPLDRPKRWPRRLLPLGQDALPGVGEDLNVSVDNLRKVGDAPHHSYQGSDVCADCGGPVEWWGDEDGDWIHAEGQPEDGHSARVALVPDDSPKVGAAAAPDQGSEIDSGAADGRALPGPGVGRTAALPWREPGREDLSDLALHLVEDHEFGPSLVGDPDLFNEPELVELHESDHADPAGEHRHNPEVLRVATEGAR